MNCLEDQNFFYYEKEKSDIFILAMILVDLALLKTNYLYDVSKRKAHLDNIPGLLKKVGERYTSTFSSILSEMLRIESKMRPSFTQIIERVEKCNNIGEDFTLETESNLKSNSVSSEKDHQDRIAY
jgi:predicted transcriptional regulator with HTH domain